MNKKHSVCAKKDSFRTKAKAEAVAMRWGQRVYECPICFCWHCTSKENWRDDFIWDEETVTRKLKNLERELRTEFNAKKKELNQKISALEYENAKLRKIIGDKC